MDIDDKPDDWQEWYDEEIAPYLEEPHEPLPTDRHYYACERPEAPIDRPWMAWMAYSLSCRSCVVALGSHAHAARDALLSVHGARGSCSIVTAYRYARHIHGLPPLPKAS